MGDTTDGKIVRRTGLGKATISRIVNGNATPAIATLMRLSRVYDIPVELLLEDADDMAAAS
jgi:transcriptional regulator with XRE-family HTH domain